MFKCKACGAGLRFDPQKQKLVCDYCTTEFDAKDYGKEAVRYADEHDLTPEEAEFFKDELLAAEDGTTYKANLITCPQCGGQLLTTDQTAATFCSFCGSSVLLQSRITREKRPSYIIPFKMTREDCEKKYNQNLRRSLYAPSFMTKHEQVERFRGIYMPYWVYSYDINDKISMNGSKEHRRGDYIYTKHYNLKTNVKAHYDGIAYDGSASFSDNLSQAIAPFDFHEAESFDPSYLSGFYADTNDVQSHVYQKDAEAVVQEHATSSMYAAHEISTYGVSYTEVEKKVRPVANKPKLALYPVWFLATRNKKNDRVSYAVINGQTGEVAMDIPADPKKMILGTILLAIPIFLLLNLGLTLTPTAALILTMIFGGISLVLANWQLNVSYNKEHKLDDKGYLSNYPAFDEPKVKTVKPAKQKAVRSNDLRHLKTLFGIVACFMIMGLASALSFEGSAILIFGAMFLMIIFTVSPKMKKKHNKPDTTVTSAPGKQKFKTLWKPLLGVLASIVILAAHPANDLYYYTAAIIAMFFVAWAFVDIIRIHNQMSTRPLPQFGRRGGDEDGTH